MRERVACAAVILVVALGGCTPSAPPSPSLTPTPSHSVVQRDFTQPGEAEKVISELVAAAGSSEAIKVEITATTASLSVVDNLTARTFAWRDGTIGEIESDTRYVGQKIFDPREFAIPDLGQLFRQAGGMAGSTSQQQLQIVEYAGGDVYMTVTTNPESLAIFFGQDGSVVAHLDLTTSAGIRQALSDTGQGAIDVLSVGILPDNQGLYVDTQYAAGAIERSVRMPKFPVRTTSGAGTEKLTPFTLSLVDPDAIADVIQTLPATTGEPLTSSYSLTISQRKDDTQPLMRFSFAGQAITTTLAGVAVAP